MSDPDTPLRAKPWQRPWFRFYAEVVEDPKVQTLPAALFKTWANILCVAARHDGNLPSIDSLAFTLRLSEKETAKRVEELVVAGLLDRDRETLRPHNWNGRQPPSDTSTARVQRHRKQLEDAKTVSGNGTEPFPETESEAARNAQKPFQETTGNAARNGLESESDSDQEKDIKSSSSSAAAHAAEDGLPEELRQAAGAHVAPPCSDVDPIRDLIAKGCDLQLDVLPTIRARVPTLKEPLSTWRAGWLVREILASRDARLHRKSACAPLAVGRARKLEARIDRPGASAPTAAAAPSGANWRDLGRSIGDVALTVTSHLREAAVVDAPSSGVVGGGQTHES